jgi:hypothetical protein
MGGTPIAAPHAAAIEAFYEEHFNSYLTFIESHSDPIGSTSRRLYTEPLNRSLEQPTKPNQGGVTLHRTGGRKLQAIVPALGPHDASAEVAKCALYIFHNRARMPPAPTASFALRCSKLSGRFEDFWERASTPTETAA